MNYSISALVRSCYHFYAISTWLDLSSRSSVRVITGIINYICPLVSSTLSIHVSYLPASSLESGTNSGRINGKIQDQVLISRWCRIYQSPDTKNRKMIASLNAMRCYFGWLEKTQELLVNVIFSLVRRERVSRSSLVGEKAAA